MAESYLTRTKPRYSLRESSKVTSRYRDYIEEQGTTTTQGQNSTQAALQNRRYIFYVHTSSIDAIQYLS
jgi:hypothetical protein